MQDTNCIMASHIVQQPGVRVGCLEARFKICWLVAFFGGSRRPSKPAWGSVYRAGVTFKLQQNCIMAYHSVR